MSGLSKFLSGLGARFFHKTNQDPGTPSVVYNLYPNSDLSTDFVGTIGASSIAHTTENIPGIGSINAAQWTQADSSIVIPAARRNINVKPGRQLNISWYMYSDTADFAKNQIRAIVDGTTYYLQADFSWSTTVYEWTWPYSALNTWVRYSLVTAPIPQGTTATLDMEDMYRAVTSFNAYVAAFQVTEGAILYQYNGTGTAISNLFTDSSLINDTTETVGTSSTTHGTEAVLDIGSTNVVTWTQGIAADIVHPVDSRTFDVPPGENLNISWYYNSTLANAAKQQIYVTVDGTQYYLQLDGKSWSTTAEEWVPPYDNSATWKRLSIVTDPVPTGSTATLKIQPTYRNAPSFTLKLTGYQVTIGQGLYGYMNTSVISPPPPPASGTQTVTYQADTTTDFPNPERGFTTSSASTTPLSSSNPFYGIAPDLRLQWNHQVIPVTSGSIPSAWLTDLGNYLAAFRSTDVKCILRFTYNYDSSGLDAPVGVVLGHIGQIAAVVNQYTDVIYALQAGLIGAWGEWHDSSSNLLLGSDSNGWYRDQIINELFTQFDSSIPIVFRRTAFIGPADSLSGYQFGTYLTHLTNSSDYFTTTKYGRAGVHNDCLFIDQYVNGYEDNYYNVSGTRGAAIGAAATAATPSGGESCSNNGAPNIYSSFSNASSIATKYHMDYINASYYTPIYQAWSAADRATFSRRLGYRFVMTESTLPTAATAGSSMDFSITMRNDGYGKLVHARPLKIVFIDGSSTATEVTAFTDCRSQLPLAGTTSTISGTITVPAGLAAGTYSLKLVLPDASPNLSSRIGSMIRLANTGAWDAATGYNDLNATITIS